MLLIRDGDPLPKPEFWRDHVYGRAVSLMRSLSIIPQMELYQKTPATTVFDVERQIRGLVPPGMYRSYDRTLSAVLGVTKHTEENEFFVVVLRGDNPPTLVPLLDFLSLENSTKGSRERYGIRYWLSQELTPRALCRFWSHDGVGIRPCYRTLWKDETNQYAVLGSVLMPSPTNIALHGVLYVPLYEPHAGKLVVRPHYDPDRKRSAGFFDGVRDRKRRNGESYSGVRFIPQDRDAERESLLTHISRFH